MQKHVVLCFLLGASLVAVSCAQDVGDIDRTQPNKLRKEVLTGPEENPHEWYMRQTVVGLPGTGTVGFVGYESGTERVRFVVEEDNLLARRVHEDVVGLDTSDAPTLEEGAPGLQGTSIYGEDEHLGSVVMAFPVKQHFDVQRQYNSSTGEQTNVISENGSDRNWAERDWVRVAWGQPNVYTGENGLFVAVEKFGLGQEGWYEDDNEDSNFIHAECKDAEGNWYVCDTEDLTTDDDVAYLEVTTSWVLFPNWIDCVLTFGFPNWGGSCGPETITVRTSFERVDQEEVQSYEPRIYSDNEMEWFGFFRTNRCAYDRLYGCRDDSRIELANGHNIWQGWYTDEDDDGLYTEGVDTRIPYSERDTKPIVYYMNDEYPEDLFDESVEIADQYNDIFTEVVTELGANQTTNRMFYLCANTAAQVENVEDGAIRNALMAGYEEGVCDRPEYNKRFGDIRYNFFGWVHNPQQRGPLGYGPSTTDSVTGETIGADAYIYGAALDTWAQMAVDLVDLINGELDPVEYGFGENVEGYLSDINKVFRAPSLGWKEEGAGGSIGVTPEDLERYAELDEKLTAAQERVQRWNKRGLVDLDAKTLDTGKLLPDNQEILHRNQDRHVAIWEQLKDTKHEHLFVTPEMKVGLGMGLIGPEDPTNQEIVDMIGPRSIGMPPAGGAQKPTSLLRQDPFGLPKLSQDELKEQQGYDYFERMERFSSRNMFMAEFLDDGLMGLATRMAKKYKDVKDPVKRRLNMFYDIRGIVFKHVMEHEVGHTVGLRHNFGGTWDPMSFDKRYWEIRAEGDQELRGLNEDCPFMADQGLQLGDPHCPTRSIIDQDWEKGMTEYAYTTTMDYGRGPTATSHGLGLYDKAALAYRYGELVHVFKPEAEPKKIEVTFASTSGALAASDDAIKASSETVTDFEDIDVIKVEGSDTSDWYDGNMDFWHYSVLPVMFGAVDDGDMSQMYEREFVSLADYNPEDPQRLRVPYRFCSDFFRGASPQCDVWDDGADYHEVSTRFMRDYDAYYFVNSYRRGRASWGLWIWPHLSRMLGRYFMPVSNMYQHWTVRASVWPFWFQNPYGGAGIQQVGIEDGLRGLVSVLGDPHPGTYEMQEDGTYLNVSSNTGANVDETFGPRVDLEPGLDVKWRFSRFDYDSGYYYFLRYSILSSFWDRWAAMMALTTPEYNTVGVDAASDITAYLIPYYLLYSSEMSRIFGSIMAEDFTGFSPLIDLRAMGGSGDSRDALVNRDPLASVARQGEFNDPDKFASLNPYPATYGNSGFNDRYFASLYSLSFFQVLYDKSFNHSSDITIMNEGGLGSEFADSDGDGLLDIQEQGFEDMDGDGLPPVIDADEQPADPAAMPEVVQYEDPFNHDIYVAVRYTQNLSPLYSPGVSILNRAKRLKRCWRDPSGADCTGPYSDVNEFDVQNIREDIEIIMEINDIFF